MAWCTQSGGTVAGNESLEKWVTAFYPVQVLGGAVLSLHWVANCSPVLDENLAPMGPGTLSSTGAGVWRNAPGALPDSSSPPFLRILFFFFFFALSNPPFPRRFSSPKSPLSGTLSLLFLVKKRQPAEAGFWGRFWTGSPHRKRKKKENPFFLAREKR